MNEPRVRIARVIGFGLLAEVLTAVIIVSALRIFASGDDVAAQRLAAILGPGFGVLFTFFAALFAARPVPDRARQHGVLVGGLEQGRQDARSLHPWRGGTEGY